MSKHPLLPIETEASLIRSAQARDPEAYAALKSAYSRAIRSAVRRFQGSLDPDDLAQEVDLALLELIDSHDPETSPRLAGRVTDVLNRVLSEAVAGACAWSIPERTLTRYAAVMREADSDVVAGVRLAPGMGMASVTFVHIYNLLNTSSIDEDPGAWDAAQLVVPGPEMGL